MFPGGGASSQRKRKAELILMQCQVKFPALYERLVRKLDAKGRPKAVGQKTTFAHEEKKETSSTDTGSYRTAEDYIPPYTDRVNMTPRSSNRCQSASPDDLSEEVGQGNVAGTALHCTAASPDAITQIAATDLRNLSVDSESSIVVPAEGALEGEWHDLQVFKVDYPVVCSHEEESGLPVDAAEKAQKRRSVLKIHVSKKETAPQGTDNPTILSDSDLRTNSNPLHIDAKQPPSRGPEAARNRERRPSWERSEEGVEIESILADLAERDNDLSGLVAATSASKESPSTPVFSTSFLTDSKTTVEASAASNSPVFSSSFLTRSGSAVKDQNEWEQFPEFPDTAKYSKEGATFHTNTSIQELQGPCVSTHGREFAHEEISPSQLSSSSSSNKGAQAEDPTSTKRTSRQSSMQTLTSELNRLSTELDGLLAVNQLGEYGQSARMHMNPMEKNKSPPQLPPPKDTPFHSGRSSIGSKRKTFDGRSLDGKSQESSTRVNEARLSELSSFSKTEAASSKSSGAQVHVESIAKQTPKLSSSFKTVAASSSEAATESKQYLSLTEEGNPIISSCGGTPAQIINHALTQSAPGEDATTWEDFPSPSKDVFLASPGDGTKDPRKNAQYQQDDVLWTTPVEFISADVEKATETIASLSGAQKDVSAETWEHFSNKAAFTRPSASPEPSDDTPVDCDQLPTPFRRSRFKVAGSRSSDSAEILADLSNIEDSTSSGAPYTQGETIEDFLKLADSKGEGTTWELRASPSRDIVPVAVKHRRAASWTKGTLTKLPSPPRDTSRVYKDQKAPESTSCSAPDDWERFPTPTRTAFTARSPELARTASWPESGTSMPSFLSVEQDDVSWSNPKDDSLPQNGSHSSVVSNASCASKGTKATAMDSCTWESFEMTKAATWARPIARARIEISPLHLHPQQWKEFHPIDLDDSASDDSEDAQPSLPKTTQGTGNKPGSPSDSLLDNISPKSVTGRRRESDLYTREALDFDTSLDDSYSVSGSTKASF